MTGASQYYGRGGARLCIPRPRIETETRLACPARVLRTIDIISPVRFLALLIALLAMILLSDWIFTHFHHSRIQNQKKITPQPLKLVMQYQPTPKRKPAAPQPQKLEKPKPMLPPLQPATEQPKAAPPKVVRKKAKPAPKPKPAALPKPAPQPKPVEKKRLDLEDSLSMEKKFVFPLTDAGSRPAARTAPPPASSSLSVNRKMPDSISDIQPVAPDRNRQRTIPKEVRNKLNHLEDDLALKRPAKPYPKIETDPAREVRVPLARTRQPAFNRESEIDVAVAEDNSYDYSDIQPDPSSQMTAPPPAFKTNASDADAVQAAPGFTESGVSLIQLKACGPAEKAMKLKLAELVQKKGYPRECSDNSGIYKFYWPVERFTVQHFNVIIYTSQGRIATDRCEELTNACDCLTNR